jgi:hypothetical protein
MIIQAPFLVPKPFSGFSAWPFIIVKDKADKVLIAHEMVHYKEQAWITPIWLLRYWLSKSFRLQAEVRAYRVTIALGGMTIEQAALWLCNYDDSLSPMAALRMLQT